MIIEFKTAHFMHIEWSWRVNKDKKKISKVCVMYKKCKKEFSCDAIITITNHNMVTNT